MVVFSEVHVCSLGLTLKEGAGPKGLRILSFYRGRYRSLSILAGSHCLNSHLNFAGPRFNLLHGFRRFPVIRSLNSALVWHDSASILKVDWSNIRWHRSNPAHVITRCDLLQQAQIIAGSRNWRRQFQQLSTEQSSCAYNARGLARTSPRRPECERVRSDGASESSGA